MEPTPKRIGDILVNHGAIARATLEKAAATSRGRLGDFLHAHGLIEGRALSHAVAQQAQLTMVDFSTNAPDDALFRPRDLDHYLAHRFVPYRREDGVLLLATPAPSAALAAFAASHYGEPIRFVITGRRDMADYFAQRAALTTTRRARLSLRRRRRHLVADRILLPHQSRSMLLLALLLGCVAIFIPATGWQMLLIACNLFYLTTLALKIMLYTHGRTAQREQATREHALKIAAQSLDAATLPVYSILIPMYHESSDVMARLIGHLNALDYPKEKLDIKLICEADDVETLHALRALRPPATMEILRVPPSTPRTKPKACNVALHHIRGDYLVIFDAEDAPATDQLRLAVAMFRAGPKNLACLQGSLNYYNRNENLLTQLFAIEYSAFFRLSLPALERLNLPIPLGGTSNHLCVAALNDAGGWDAFNVTEDADLGIRLAYLGYVTRTLPSLTLEEAPITVDAWMKQRTRWIKGYIQTWLVFTRDTAELKRRLGPAGYYGFQFFVGAPALTFLMAPFFWVAFLVSLLGVFPTPLSPTMLGLCLISFFGGIIGHWLFARAVMQLEGWDDMRKAVILYPLYWLLHSVAAARALWQLITAPHYWEKTRHGVSKGLKTPIAPHAADMQAKADGAIP
ncbi:MAG: glycosyltransferase family 2 protein [Pseudomonadota bacterium]